MLSPGNVATPATAATVVVPERVPLPGFEIGRAASRAGEQISVVAGPLNNVTCIAGVIAAPATVLLGWTLKLSCVAAPAVMLSGVEVVPLMFSLVAVSV